MAYIQHLINRDGLNGFSIIPSLRERECDGKMKTPKGLKPDLLLFYQNENFFRVTGRLGSQHYFRMMKISDNIQPDSYLNFIFKNVLVNFGYRIEDDEFNALDKRQTLDSIIHIAEDSIS